MEAKSHKCPSCFAPLKYTPEILSWECEYCGEKFKLEDIKKEENTFDFNEENEQGKMDVDEYTCSSCGAKIITDENTTATFCVYCGNTSIIKNRLLGMLRPKNIIPFKNTKEQAVEAFLKFKKGKPFAPKLFGEAHQIEKITGVYIPFWLYDCTVDASISGTGTNIRSWRSGNYRCTKTDTYKVSRCGEAKFIRVPVDGATKFDDDIMDSIEPFNYDEICKFSSEYLSGFLAEKYDVNEKEAYKRVEDRINNAIDDYLKSDIKGYSSVSLNTPNINKKLNKAEYALFPVWMMNVTYNDKYYMFAMNGQTGKMVGNIPVSWGKFFLWFGGLFLCIFSILMLLLTFIGGC